MYGEEDHLLMLWQEILHGGEDGGQVAPIFLFICKDLYGGEAHLCMVKKTTYLCCGRRYCMVEKTVARLLPSFSLYVKTYMVEKTTYLCCGRRYCMVEKTVAKLVWSISLYVKTYMVEKTTSIWWISPLTCAVAGDTAWWRRRWPGCSNLAVWMYRLIWWRSPLTCAVAGDTAWWRRLWPGCSNLAVECTDLYGGEAHLLVLWQEILHGGEDGGQVAVI